MQPQALVPYFIPGLTWLFLAALLGTIGALAVGVAILQGRRIPAAVSGLPVGLPLIVAAGQSAAGLHAISVASAPEVVRAAVLAGIGQRIILPLVLGIPASVALFLAAGGGALPAPRHRMSMTIGIIASLSVAAIVGYAGQQIDDPLFTRVRAAAYLGAGGILSVAMLAGDRRGGSGPEAAGFAGVTFAMLVSAGEVSARALAELQAIVGLSSVDAPLREQVAAAFSAEVFAVQHPLAVIAVVVACTPTVVSVVLAATSVQRAIFCALGGLWCGVAIAFCWAGNPDLSLLVLAAAPGATSP